MDVQPAHSFFPRTGLHLVNSQVPAVQPISIRGLSVRYQQLLALEQITAEFYPGRVTGIIGPNGAGKSTLLQAMLGLIPAASGAVRFGTGTLADQRHQVAYVPQRSQIDWLYPATVWDVVLMGRVQKTGWFRRFSAASRQQARAALERVGMAELRHRPIGQLSGGQQQRVFLARSLAQEANVFCFDEPFVGVDQKTETVLFEIFHELANAGKVVIVVNHDLGEAITNFDDLVLLNRSLIASGPRQQVLNSENLRYAYGGTVSFYAA